MSESPSPFYPPRARGWGHLRRVRSAFQRIIYSSPVQFSEGFITAVSSSVVPGYVFRLLGYPVVAKLAMGAYATAAILFLIALGFPLGNYAFAFMLALHATSALMAFRRYVPASDSEYPLITFVGILAILVVSY